MIIEKNKREEKEKETNYFFVTRINCVGRGLEDFSGFVYFRSKYNYVVVQVINLNKTFFIVNYFVAYSVEIISVSRGSIYSTVQDIFYIVDKSYFLEAVRIMNFFNVSLFVIGRIRDKKKGWCMRWLYHASRSNCSFTSIVTIASVFLFSYNILILENSVKLFV